MSSDCSPTPAEEYDRRQERRVRSASRWINWLIGVWLVGQGCGAAIVLTERVDWNAFGPLAAWMDLIWTLTFCGFLASGAAALLAGCIVVRNWSVLRPTRIVLGLLPWGLMSALGALFLFAVLN